MATEEQLRLVLQQNAEMKMAMEGMNQRLVEAETRLTTARSGATASTTTTPALPAPIVDMRMLGKPDSFSGQNWRDWSIVTRSYAAACCPVLAPLMEAAAQTEDVVDNVGLSVDQRQASTQLYYILVMLCKEGPLTRIINAGP
eukprot:4777720-Amphidinium_carterae.2